jgi:hypothetical protein
VGEDIGLSENLEDSPSWRDRDEDQGDQKSKICRVVSWRKAVQKTAQSIPSEPASMDPCTWCEESSEEIRWVVHSTHEGQNASEIKVSNVRKSEVNSLPRSPTQKRC